MQLLARQGIDLPVTGIAHSPDDTSDLIDMVGGAPLVVKLVEGTQGIGVVLAETRQAAESVIDAFRGLNAHILVQQDIVTAGASSRCRVGDGDAAIDGERKQAIFVPICNCGGSVAKASHGAGVNRRKTGDDGAGRCRCGNWCVIEGCCARRGDGRAGGKKQMNRHCGKPSAEIERHATTEYCLKTGG